MESIDHNGEKRQVAIGIVGPGLIGKTLLSQLALQTDRLREEWGLELQVFGVTNSQWMLLSATPISLSSWQTALESQDTEASLDSFTYHFATSPVADRVIIDCTASAAVPCHYTKWLSLGIHVITPNKRLGSGPLADYLAVKEAQRHYHAHFMAEGTVGAGLPVLSTLQSMINTGDKVAKIEGVFSGTLSFIFNNFGPGRPFSDVVGKAKAAGYTEPDPREDLSGMDVARKVVILARECGMQIELEDVAVESLVPEPLQSTSSVLDFMDQLPQFDADMEARASEAAEAGNKLVYVGLVDVAAGKCTVSLQSYPADHAFAQLSGSDNIIAFTTRRYSQQPLMIRGPGAGAEVTAAGVFGDLLQVAQSLGA
ncbi:homoserine dehydrogenase [Coccomyxa subellipsoidea C-169]|uniref:Homoserine dehydrogenase n=1 Tax=Coccomyxa subellipsoidea (strain C-169) TaxID=574566 RepID=I0YMS1_COCSC|nr:homoserine dehydrogenase [Coccomyxa subellipsoidea C-169]EIE19690.1 homoserine dehydrogenase [Coccomyxa subellipsoidea C-169]|eukprot:XP_005644234.1 homoserine dehydrogenase [Coccomyxa subellipsoidea C-169]